PVTNAYPYMEQDANWVRAVAMVALGCHSPVTGSYRSWAFIAPFVLAPPKTWIPSLNGTALAPDRTVGRPVTPFQLPAGSRCSTGLTVLVVPHVNVPDRYSPTYP